MNDQVRQNRLKLNFPSVLHIENYILFSLVYIVSSKLFSVVRKKVAQIWMGE